MDGGSSTGSLAGRSSMRKPAFRAFPHLHL